MKNFYDPKGIFPIEEEIEEHVNDYMSPALVVEFKKDHLFHIGQSYEKEVADTIYCKNCGGKEFNVGQGDFYTAIRCVTCEFEICIHDG